MRDKNSNGDYCRSSSLLTLINVQFHYAFHHAHFLQIATNQLKFRCLAKFEQHLLMPIMQSVYCVTKTCHNLRSKYFSCIHFLLPLMHKIRIILAIQISIGTKSMQNTSQIINNLIVAPCFVSLAIRQSPCTKGHLTQHRKPPRFNGQHAFILKFEQL